MEEIKRWYKEYEIKTVFDRAVPSIMDGFKPVQRKIFYTALSRLKSKMNTNAFSGAVKEYSNYHHGDMSIVATVNNMVAEFRNNFPIFLGYGNFGDKLEHTPAAARYTEISLNPEYLKYMVMNEILEYEIQDDNKIHEPNYYLFTLPMVLINGTRGIAVGMKTDILPYKLSDIKRNVKQVINNKKQTPLIPFFPQFKGKVKRENSKWVQYGNIELENSTTIKITELTTNYESVKYLQVLEELKENKVIYDYEDNSSDKVEIVAKVTKEVSKKIRNKLHKTFKLVYNLQENIKVLDPSGTKVLEFNTPEELIETFVLEVLKKCDRYRIEKMKEYEKTIDKLIQKIKFIKFVSCINNITDLSRKELKRLVLEKIKIDRKYLDEFLQISIFGLTKDSVKKYEKEIKEFKIKLNKFKRMNKNDIYLGMII